MKYSIQSLCYLFGGAFRSTHDAGCNHDPQEQYTLFVKFLFLAFTASPLEPMHLQQLLLSVQEVEW